MATNKKHYGDNDGLKVLSYNGIITAVNSNRNFGKTWTFKKRAVKRAFKHNKKTIWLRMFKKETRQAIDTFFKSKDLQQYCNISIYNKDTNPNGNIKQEGNTFYYRKGKKWNWFIKCFSLSDADAVRSADDVDVDTIIFDEYTKTQDKYKRYRGDLITDFIDIFFSAKREHEIRIICLGNKESVSNPLFAYFGIKPLPYTFEGIRTYRNGAFVVQQINNEQDETSDYDMKLKTLLSGTKYGDYIYKSTYKTSVGFKPRKTPATASIYCQLSINSQPIKISVNNGLFYVNMKIDNTRRVYCDVLNNKYKIESLLVKKQKRFFLALINALSDNRVYYDNAMTYEAITPFYNWLSV